MYGLPKSLGVEQVPILQTENYEPRAVLRPMIRTYTAQTTRFDHFQVDKLKIQMEIFTYQF